MYLGSLFSSPFLSPPPPGSICPHLDTSIPYQPLCLSSLSSNTSFKCLIYFIRIHLWLTGLCINTPSSPSPHLFPPITNQPLPHSVFSPIYWLSSFYTLSSDTGYQPETVTIPPPLQMSHEPVICSSNILLTLWKTDSFQNKLQQRNHQISISKK